MANRHGAFVWYELLTTDVNAAAEFYGAVIGWRLRAATQLGTDYRQFGIGETDVAGVMALPSGAADMGTRPIWHGYVGVDDVDASVARIKAAGGAVRMPAQDIPGVGRFAMLADPQGALFYVMRGSVDGQSTSFSPDAVGRCGWNELYTSDPAAALRFYTSQFSWTKGDAMSMGDMGDYQFIHHGDTRIGAMMKGPTGGPRPVWNFYFRVADIGAAARRITAAGGQVLQGPVDVPGDDLIVAGLDPQGASFALVGRKV